MEPKVSLPCHLMPDIRALFSLHCVSQDNYCRVKQAGVCLHDNTSKLVVTCVFAVVYCAQKSAHALLTEQLPYMPRQISNRKCNRNKRKFFIHNIINCVTCIYGKERNWKQYRNKLIFHSVNICCLESVEKDPQNHTKRPTEPHRKIHRTTPEPENVYHNDSH